MWTAHSCVTPERVLSEYNEYLIFIFVFANRTFNLNYFILKGRIFTLQFCIASDVVMIKLLTYTGIG